MAILTPQALLLSVCLYATSVVGKRYAAMEKNTNECIGACKAVNYIQCREYAASVSFDKFNNDDYYEDYYVTSPSTPKGCYAKIGNGNIVVGVYFNQDDTGASDPDFSPICARK